MLSRVSTDNFKCWFIRDGIIGPVRENSLGKRVIRVKKQELEIPVPFLKASPEAIYSTRPWIAAVEGDVKGTSGAFSDNQESVYTARDIRFTQKGNVVYAISLDWDDKGVIIESIKEDFRVSDVSMLGSDEKLLWTHTADGLEVSFPKLKPTDYAHALRIELEE